MSESDVPGVSQAMIDAAIAAYREGYGEIAADKRQLPDLYGYPMARAIAAVLRIARNEEIEIFHPAGSQGDFSGNEIEYVLRKP